MPEPIWVAELRISHRVATKIAQQHGVHDSEVRAALQCERGLRACWYEDAGRGRRAVVRVHIRHRRFVVVLFPVLHPMGGVWRLGSAYPERRWT